MRMHGTQQRWYLGSLAIPSMTGTASDAMLTLRNSDNLGRGEGVLIDCVQITQERGTCQHLERISLVGRVLLEALLLVHAELEGHILILDDIISDHILEPVPFCNSSRM